MLGFERINELSDMEREVYQILREEPTIRQMNILILNTSELTGGAAVAANRLAKALGKSGVEVSMLVRDRKTDHVKVFSVNNSWISHRLNSFRFIWERLIIFICNFFSKKNLFQVSIANTGTDL